METKELKITISNFKARIKAKFTDFKLGLDLKFRIGNLKLKPKINEKANLF
jgi:hypothetical protein